jgi:flagellar hook-basal body complex protein FliE
MNPLSAIRSPFGPDTLRAPAFTPDLAPRAIPQYELGAPGAAGGVQPASAPGATFENTLGRLIGEVNGRQAAAGEAVTGLVTGGNVPLHQAVIAMEEASVSFQLMVEVRNKLLESYQELMRMQV